MILKDKKRQFCGRDGEQSVKCFAAEKEWTERNFLTISPALPLASVGVKQTPRLSQGSSSSVPVPNGSRAYGSESSEFDMGPHDAVFLQNPSETKVGFLRPQVLREKDKNADRICLDRRGLTNLPNFVGDKNIRLLSLQHNLINRLDGFQSLGINKLVFLDLYNNQVEKISGLDSFENLRVLLMGKNRLKKIEGLKSMGKLEVLDLHGNQICHVSGLSNLTDLKVLNLAGNQIKIIEDKDLEGLQSLQELNLKRNRLRKIADLSGPGRLEKLYLSSNEILSLEDVGGVCKAGNLREITIDGNPIASANECINFFVSHLVSLQVFNHVEITEQVRRNASLWKKNKENFGKSRGSDGNGGGTGSGETRRAEVISNAKTNWEILRKQTKGSLVTSSMKDLRVLEDSDSIVERTVQSDSILSVASSLTLSSRESSAPVRDKKKGFRRCFVEKRSFSEEAAEILESSECFRLPPISASLSDDRAKEKSRTNFSESSAKPPDEEPSSPVGSEGTGDPGTESSEEESGNAESGKRSKSACHLRKNTGRRERSLTAKTKPKHGSVQVPVPIPVPALGKVREQGGDYLIEICGRCLNVYGQGALRFIDRPWNPTKAGDVTTVKFNYVSFGGICNILGKLKQRFPNAENLTFRETNISFLGQLNALADVQGLSSLQIDEEGNPIAEKNWRNYAIYRLAHWGLKTVNGKDVTEEDLTEVTREFQGLSDLVLWSLPDGLLQPLLNRLRLEGNRSSCQQSAKQWLWNADPALRSVVGKEALQWRRGTQDDLYWRHKGKTHLSYVIDLTCSAIEKLRAFESRWPEILNQLIRDTLVDYSHLDSYMKKCMQELE